MAKSKNSSTTRYHPYNRNNDYNEITANHESVRGSPKNTAEISKKPTSLEMEGQAGEPLWVDPREDKNKKISNKPPNESNCPICLESETFEQMSTLPCAHTFHAQCIDQWLLRKPRCPVCRRSIFQSGDEADHTGDISDEESFELYEEDADDESTENSLSEGEVYLNPECNSSEEESDESIYEEHVRYCCYSGNAIGDSFDCSSKRGAPTAVSFGRVHVEYDICSDSLNTSDTTSEDCDDLTQIRSNDFDDSDVSV